MEKDNTFTFDGFKVADEYFMSKGCYFVTTTSKTDKDGDNYNLEVEYDLETGEFSFSKCYEDQVLPCDDMPMEEKQKVEVYILKKIVKSPLPRKKPTNIEEVMKTYREKDIHMEDLISTISADGLSLEEAFYLYALAMHRALGDLFITIKDDDVIDVVKKAEKM